MKQIWCGTAELLERPLQLTQILMQIPPRGRERLIDDITDSPHRVDGVREQVALLGEMLDQRWEFGENLVQGVRAVTHIGQQPVGGIDDVADVVALLVQFAGESVQLAEKLSDLVGTPGQNPLDLVLQDLEIREAAAA